MIRDMVKIDEELCNGCGECVTGCHEGALQIIDGKARLISDLLCDGLGACIGHCPEGAITVEKREAEPYDEIKVIKMMIEKGKNTVIAHLKHLKEHGEFDFLKQGATYLKMNEASIPFDVSSVIMEVHGFRPASMGAAHGGGCPGSKEQTIERPKPTFTMAPAAAQPQSELRQWPVQMHLVNPAAGYFKNSDLLIAADCVAFSMGDFHQRLLKGKTLAIACPKLDHNQQIYFDKLVALIDNAGINTITVAIMQVPCCGGLLQLTRQAVEQASRKVPVKMVMIALDGSILKEEWI